MPPNILAKISFILGPISRTPIVYKNQVSGHGFWTKFFMVFSYTVFLNNMFLRYIVLRNNMEFEWNSLTFGGH
jgi:hypothetical protein